MATPDRPAACLHRSLACVYCGLRTDERDPGDQGDDWRHSRWPSRIRALACWRHRTLILDDPHYAA
jgi:hypothetical protein